MRVDISRLSPLCRFTQRYAIAAVRRRTRSASELGDELSRSLLPWTLYQGSFCYFALWTASTLRRNRRRRQNGCCNPCDRLRCTKMRYFGMRWCSCGIGVALNFILLNYSYPSFRSLSFYGKSCVCLACPSACCRCPAMDSQPLSRGRGANLRPGAPPLTPVGPPRGLWGRQRRRTKMSRQPKSSRCG